MDSIQKAIAKLYFALGESGKIKKEHLENAENSAFMAEYIAAFALRNTGESLGKRYALMGAAAALRKAAKPHRGKKQDPSGKLCKEPPRGKTKQTRSRKAKEWEDDFEEDYGYD